MGNRRLTALAAGMLGLGFAALAQAEASIELEEIIVTAQKREQSLAETPITIEAVSGAEIAEFAAFSFEDINNLTAGLNITGNNFDTDIATRGIGTELNAGVVSRVTVYLDGAYISQDRGLFTGLYDLQQLELLKGPQGTLYGQASPAGAITIRSRDPDLEHADLSIRQSVTDREGYNTQVGASLPVVEGKFGIRVAGLYDSNRHADVRNAFLGHDDSNDTRAWRLVALWQPDDALRMRLAVHDIQDEFDIDQVVEGNGIDYDQRAAMGDIDSWYENESRYSVFEGSYTFANDWTATLVASHQDNRITRSYDMDGSPVRGQQQLVISDVPDLQNFELRLASLGNGRLDWVLGAFYQDSESETPVFVDTWFVVNSAIQGVAKTSGPALIDTNTTGLFSHNTLELSDNGTLTVGIRYNKTEGSNRQTFTSDYFLDIGGNLVPVGGAVVEGVPLPYQERDDDGLSGSLKYQYQWSDALMLYASLDRGWRAGAANIAGRVQPTVFAAFDAEDSDNLELGFKQELLEGRALLSVAAYYQVYRDFQYQASSVNYRLEDGGIALASPVVNVDEAVSYGVDTDLAVRVNEHWRVAAALSYNHAELTDAGSVPCSNGLPVPATAYAFNTCNLDGERAAEQPEWSGNLSTEYARALASGTEWYLRGLLDAESEYYSQSELRDLDGYATLDLFAGLRDPDGRWDASVWVKNLADSRAKLKTQRLDPVPDYQNGGTVDSGYVWVRRQLNPRLIGVTLAYTF